MAKAYKIIGYVLDANEYYGDLSNEDFENWFDGNAYFGRSEFHSAVFKVECKEISDEEIYDEDGCSSGLSEEDYKKYFKE